MKNLKLLFTFALVFMLSVVLVACNQPTPPAEPEFDAAELVGGFEDAVEGTVKLTYVTNYKVDVERPGADASGLASFKRDVVATAVVEIDLGADLYLKVSKTRQDKLVENAAVKSEYLLYKEEGKYYYVSSNSLKEEVAAENAAAKLAAILEEATYEQVGGLSLSSLIYNSLDKAYELKEFSISETFMADELADPVYSAGANGGLKVNYKPDYVGYRTDGGWSDFPGADNSTAADIEINTNDKGYVVSMKETYTNPSLVFNIMSNPPTVKISGERSYTATYGEAITKANTVEFATPVASLKEALGGAYVVMTCAMGDFGNLVPVADGATLELGKIIAVKPTAAEGYELTKVVVNGLEEPMINPANAGGFYCYHVKPGQNTIEVVFTELDPTAGIVNVTNNTSYDYQLQSFNYVNGAPSGYKVITDGRIEPGQSVFGAIVIDSTKEVVVTVNGAETSVNIPANGVVFYCFSVKQSGKFDVVISEKGAPVAGNAIVTVTNNTSYEYEVQSFTYAGAPSNYQVVTDGVIVPGDSIWGAIVISASTPVTVVVNGAATQINIPANGVVFYSFSVKTGGDYVVEINPAA